MKILVVEDDQPTAAALSEALTAQYYTVDVAPDGQAGLELATACDYALILMDLLIPKLDGIALCRQLRVQGYQKPILLLTAKDEIADAVKGLDAGADDYVAKPYDLSELLARIRALLRRGKTNLAHPVLTWEKLCVNPVSAEVTYAGQKLSLSPKEYSLLGLFLRNPQRIFSRSDIIDRLWSIGASPHEGTVTNLIKDLRQKLKAIGMTTDLLETVYGLGYRLKPAPESAPNSNEPTPSSASLSDRQPGVAAVNTVLKRYQSAFADRVVSLEQVELALRTGTLSQSLQQHAVQEAHKLAGALGSFGYANGSRLARSLEQLLMADELPNAQTAALFSQLVATLKQELAQSPVPLASPSPVGSQISQVLVIDAEVGWIEQLQATASAWGVQLDVATNLTIAPSQLAQRPPNAILLNLNKHEIESGLGLLGELKELLPDVPLLVMTEQDRLSDRVAVSRLGVQRFLPKPITVSQVLEAIIQVLPTSQMTQAKVLILDDDPVILIALRELLQPWGLQVTTLHDPLQFWDVLTATQPQVLVMDLEMPEFNGIDLCRVVRQDSQWGNLPILVVTAHTDMKSIQQVFAAGADDFIEKPIVGPEFVTRVISRIDRARLQQELEIMKRRIGT